MVSEFCAEPQLPCGLVERSRSRFPVVVVANAPDPVPSIRVHVDNYSQASPTTLSGAERVAGRILGDAGLQIVWLNCPVGNSSSVPQNPCQRPLEPADIVLRIIPEPAKNTFQDSVFGFAVVPLLASVYYDYAVRRAKIDAADFEAPHSLGLRRRPRNRAFAPWLEQSFRLGNYAGTVGT